jgi:hypothetical protein
VNICVHLRCMGRGSLAFPAPSSALPVTWRTLEGSPTQLVGPVSFAASDLLLFVTPSQEP